MELFTSPCSEQITGPAGQLFTMLMQSIIKTPCNLSTSWPDDFSNSIDSGNL